MVQKSERIDLHCHTTASDGLLSPNKVLERAARVGVTTLSITDHDSVDAYSPQVRQEAQSNGIRLIPGIELSVSDAGGSRAHILGLGIDVGHPVLRHVLDEQRAGRILYTQQVCEKLHELGWEISAKELISSRATITKAHIARALLTNPKNATALRHEFGDHPTAGEFIESHMIHETDGYVATPKQISTKQAVSTIHQAGGVAIFAHPVAQLYESNHTLTSLEEKISRSGVDGLEAYYIYYAKSAGDIRVNAISDMLAIAERQNLLVTGGSDFHGDDPSIGNFVELGFANQPLQIPDQILELLDAKAATNNY